MPFDPQNLARQLKPTLGVLSEGAAKLGSKMLEQLGEARDSLAHAGRAIKPVGQRLSQVAQGAAGWFSRSLKSGFITSSLQRRIFFSNLLGLLVLIIGIFYLENHNAWLINAKIESLVTQGEIISRAIGANASMEKDGMAIDVSKLPEGDASLVPYRDDAFAAIDFSIRPERVTSILKKLMEPTRNRARIYGREYGLVVDSAQILSKGQILHPDPKRDARVSAKPRSFLTRMTEWLLGGDMPVYREIGSAKGSAYPEVRMAMTSGATTPILLLDDNAEQIVSVAVPIQRLRSTLGVLLLSTTPGEIDAILWKERLGILGISALALLATLAASTLLARTVAGPIRRLSEAAEHVSHNIGARRELPDYSDRSDEVGQMSDAFRSMTAALYRRIEASEKFAADVAHELKNPLTAARSTAESLSYAKTPEQRDQLVGQIQAELKRLNRLITDVSKASRLDAELALQQTEPVDLKGVLEGVVGIFRDMLQGDGRKIALNIEPSSVPDAFIVNGHDGRLAQVLTNLVDNALSFTPPQSTVTVSARRQGADVFMIVEDQGPGIPADRLDAVFDRFYSDRPETDLSRGKNSGLGLSISREIVNALHGRIWAENIVPIPANDALPVAAFTVGETAGKAGRAHGAISVGARFTVRLPAATQAQVRAGHAATLAAAQRIS